MFVDAWRQSARAGPEVNKDIYTRMTYAYKRSAKAMAITSCTTFGAFAATATSPLGEVATFGLFTALLVVANYCFVITYFPAAVLIYHRRCEGTSGCCCCGSGKRLIPPTPERGAQVVTPSAPIVDDGSGLRDPPPLPIPVSATPPDGTPDENAGTALPNATPPTKVEVFCTVKFAPLVNSSAKYGMVGVLVIVAIVLMIQATKLGPTTKEDQLLPDWHKFQRIINMFNNDFQQGEDVSTSIRSRCFIRAKSGYETHPSSCTSSLLPLSMYLNLH